MEGIPVTKSISSYIIQSQDEEIKRIALELHEGVGQTLYSLYTGLQYIEMGIEQPGMKAYLQEMQQTMERTIKEIQMLSVELHPPTLSLGLVSAIKSYVRLYTSTYGIIVKVDSIGEEKILPEQNKIAIFRVCQEALINIAKYADIDLASIQLDWREDDIKVVIVDHGQGFNVKKVLRESLSSGLGAMQERMLLAGGTCDITSAQGKGTSILIDMPL